MKKKFVRFSDIEGFRHVVYNVNRHAEFEGMDDNDEPIMNPSNPKPTIRFTGTVKMHGTNAGISWNGEEIWAQSRKNIITPEKDNHGFAFFFETKKDLLLDLMKAVKIIHGTPDDAIITIFGEWCGGNVQGGVALRDVDKMFVIFKIKVATPDEEEANEWLDYDHSLYHSKTLNDNSIHFIQDYTTFNIDIDFNKPEESQNRLVELTNIVEKECPVAKVHGASGVGEGIVWSGFNEGNSYVFKVKGKKHSGTKVKKLAGVDIEKVNSIKEFVEYAVTENRLKQGIDEVFLSQGIDIDKRGIGNYLKWVQGDVIKEEMDTLVKNRLEPKEVNGAISKKAVTWIKEKYLL